MRNNNMRAWEATNSMIGLVKFCIVRDLVKTTLKGFWNTVTVKTHLIASSQIKNNLFGKYKTQVITQADHPLLVGPLKSEIDLLLFIEEIQMNNTVATICSDMQNLKQMIR